MNFNLYICDWITIIPEIFLVLSVVLLLLYSAIYSVSPFLNYPVLITNTLWLSIYILFIAFFLNYNVNLFFYSTINFLIVDYFGKFIKGIVIVLTICVLITFLNYNKYEYINNSEYSIILILTILGTLLVISSYNLIVLYLAIELQSFCSYILCSFKRNSEHSAEAALKYFILGAFSSSFLLFGCSLVYGFAGVLNYDQLLILYIGEFSNYSDINGVVIGIIFILVSLLFKLAAAPFHFWSPDVYEGSPIIITLFFAIVPKFGIFVFFMRLFFDSFYNLFIPLQFFIVICSIISMLVGSFGALSQNKLKRLLAFSSISHVGYMLMCLSSFCIDNIYSLIVYLIFYVIMLLSSFLLIIMLNNNININRLKYIEDLVYLSKTNFFLGIPFLITFFSISGIPPFSGFFAKLFVFYTAIGQQMYLLCFVGIFTSIISCFYYLRIIQLVYFTQITKWVSFKKLEKETSIILTLTTLLLILFIIHPNLLLKYIYNSVIYFTYNIQVA